MSLISCHEIAQTAMVVQWFAHTLDKPSQWNAAIHSVMIAIVCVFNLNCDIARSVVIGERERANLVQLSRFFYIFICMYFPILRRHAVTVNRSNFTRTRR